MVDLDDLKVKAFIGLIGIGIVVVSMGYDELKKQMSGGDNQLVAERVEARPSQRSSPAAGVSDAEVGLPELLGKKRSQLIRHKGYVVDYNSQTKQPNWVAWTLTPERFEEVAGRSDKFLPDPEVADPVTTDDYKHSGYDRGHICPAADNKWDKQAMQESFYMTNICPQNHNLNGGDWKELEEACRDWTMEYGQLYVVGGPVFEGVPHKHIGDSRVAVPDAFFKVVLCLSPSKAIGFVFANKAGSRPLRTYACTVDEVEQLTGIDFFLALPDSLEQAVEATCDFSGWAAGE